MERHYYVYILASDRNGTLYVGITNDIFRRTFEHASENVESFIKRYHIHHLVHYEAFDNPAAAIKREKQLKKWNRKWKIRLIEEDNPEWRDLLLDIFNDS